jgi:hypothetical protein
MPRDNDDDDNDDDDDDDDGASSSLQARGLGALYVLSEASHSVDKE